MGKIRVKTLGDETFEKEQADKARVRREQKKAKKDLPVESASRPVKAGKSHVKGVGLKGGQQIKVMEGDEIKPEIAALLKEEPTEEKEKTARKAKPRVRSKRYKALLSQVDKKKWYAPKDAVKLLKKTANTHFDGTVEVHVNINPATLPKDKPSLSGSVNLPHGTGKKRRIRVATDEIIEQIGKGQIEFDVLVAHPSMMPKLAKHARVLGPRGLLPNPKNSTVTPDPEKRARELEGGEVNWKTDPDHPVIHQTLGKVSFTEEQIEENLRAFVLSIGTGKITKLTLTSSMGPGIKVDITSL